MAYVPRQIPKEEENKFGRSGETTPSPVPAQGGGSAGAGEGGGGMGVGGTAPGFASPTQFGSNAAKLSDYLKANADQVSDFGGKISKNLGDKYNQTVGNINQGLGNFNQQVNAGYAAPDQNRLGQAASNPSDFVKNQQNVKDFQGWYNPQYSGPKDFESSKTYSDINDQVNKAVQDSNLVGSQGGLSTYLNQNFGTANSTPGMMNLDTALLQRSPDASKSIREATVPFQNLNSYLSNTAQQANKGVADTKAQVAKSGENVRNQFQGVTDKFSQDLQNRLQQTRSSAKSSDDAFRAAVQQGKPLTTPEQSNYGVKNWNDILNLKKQLSGPTPFGDSQAQYGRNFDLNPYLSQQNPDTAITQENIATPEEYANEAALQQLTNGTFNALPEDASVAGTAPKTLSQFNSQGAGQDMSQLLGGLDKQFINQYKDFNLGAHDEAGWLNTLKDPKESASYQGMLDIYNRNPDLLNPQQKQMAGQLQNWISQTGALPPGGGDAFNPTESGSPNLRVLPSEQGGNSMQWFNGSDWVKAPSEYKYVDSDGKQVGPGSAAKTLKFNYDTGQYEETGKNASGTTFKTQPLVNGKPGKGTSGKNILANLKKRPLGSAPQPQQQVPVSSPGRVGAT